MFLIFNNILSIGSFGRRDDEYRRNRFLLIVMSLLLVQEEISFKVIYSNLSLVFYIILPNRMVCMSFVEDIIRNISVKLVQKWASRSGDVK